MWYRGVIPARMKMRMHYVICGAPYNNEFSEERDDWVKVITHHARLRFQMHVSGMLIAKVPADVPMMACAFVP